MLTISICDDNQMFLDTIKRTLERYCLLKDLEVMIKEYTSINEELIEELSRSDIVFLDIEMGDIDGISAAKMIREHSTIVKIVYLTNFAKYSLQGYEAMASGYLLKTNKDMTAVINEKMDSLMRSIKRDGIVLRTQNNGRTILIPIIDIVLFESGEKGMVSVKTKENKYYNYRTTLKQLSKQYEKHGFLRISRRFLINMRYINKISNYTVYLDNGESYQTTDINYRQLIEKFVAWEGDQ